MNSLSITNRSKDVRAATERVIEQRLEEPWFDDAPPSSRRPSEPPVVHVGEFLGDPLADAWLR